MRLANSEGLDADRLRNLIARLDALDMRTRINAGDHAPFGVLSAPVWCIRERLR